MVGNMTPISGMVLPQDNGKDPTNRAGDHYKLNHLYNCDVCWTCRIFNPNSFKCEFYDTDKDKKISIKNPEFFRCSFWEDNHYYA